MKVGPGSPFQQLGFGSAMSINAPQIGTGLSSLAPKKAGLGDLAGHVLGIRDSFGGFGLAARMKTIGSTRPGLVGVLAMAESKSPLGLTVQATPTTMAGKEEVNASPTSFSTFAPQFQGVSTAKPTFDGEYKGDQGDDVLTFTALRSGLVGFNDLQFWITDGTGEKVDEIEFKSTDPAGTLKSVNNGLEFSLSSGAVREGDSFQVGVFDSVGSVVDPDKPLDGKGVNDPNLEYGFDVTPGLFEINEVQIGVLAGDSLNDVLARITSSAAGVSASFDPATELVSLTHQTPGSAPVIELGSDSTGFFDATKLKGAQDVPGIDDDRLLVIEDVAQLDGISSGTFSINGMALSVDVQVDSLQDVLDRINASGAGVVASFDETDNTVEITPSEADGSFELDDGDSGLFTALGITPATYTSVIATESGPSFLTRSFRSGAGFSGGFEDLAGSLNQLFGTEFGPGSTFTAGLAVKDLQEAFRDSLRDYVEDEDADVLKTDFGIELHFDDPDGDVIRIDRDKLARALAERPDELGELLHGRTGIDPDPGLLSRLDGALDKIGENLLALLDPTQGVGLAVDLSA